MRRYGYRIDRTSLKWVRNSTDWSGRVWGA
jgi:hypothetical protein